jgi:hypothetical protein
MCANPEFSIKNFIAKKRTARCYSKSVGKYTPRNSPVGQNQPNSQTAADCQVYCRTKRRDCDIHKVGIFPYMNCRKRRIAPDATFA